jgi:hypothetical protein
VRVVQRTRHVAGDTQHLSNALTATSDATLQVVSFNKAPGTVHLTLCFANFMKGGNARMLQAGIKLRGPYEMLRMTAISQNPKRNASIT